MLVTPFTFEERVLPLDERVFEEITGVVEVTPLITVVKVFPERV